MACHNWTEESNCDRSVINGLGIQKVGESICDVTPVADAILRIFLKGD